MNTKMKTTEAAKGRWEEILNNWGLHFTGKRHITCPICERTKSKGMRINEHRGDCSYICVCGSGSGFNLLMEITGMSFKELANQIDEVIGNTVVKTKYVKPKIKSGISQILENLRPWQGTQTEIYLKSRGVKAMPNMSVFHCDKAPLLNEETGKMEECEAMVAKITDSLSLEVLQLHITYLKNGKKITRRLRNMVEDVDYRIPVERLMQAEKTLGISEGIETSLSGVDMFDIPVWSVLNAGFMKKFRAPLGVTELIILADNDRTGTGHAAAFECARANLSAKNDVTKVSVVWPTELGDLNDLDNVEDTCSWSFSK